MRLPVTRLTLESGADIMRLRHSARVIAETVNLSAPDQTRLVTAVSEVARNYVQAGGGALTDFHIRENGDGYSLLATLRTDGQGEIHGDEILGNLERSTARRLVHDFEMEGDPNELVIRLSMNLPALEDGETMETLASRAMDAVTQTVADDPHEEMVNQNLALMESLSEQDFLIREIHHRVKNNFQLISSLARLQAGRAHGQEANVLLESLAMRIRALGLAHEQLYRFEDITRVSFREFLSSLCGSLEAAFVSPGQSIKIDCAVTGDTTLGQDMALNIGLVVNELVTNAIKHAFPGGESGKITLGGTVDGERACISVSDDGVGNQEFADNMSSHDSLGMRLLQSSVRRIHGEMTAKEAEGGGLTVMVDFPIRGYEQAEPQA